MEAYLEVYKLKNPGFHYCLEKDSLEKDFKRVVILFPYSIKALDFCYSVVAIDAAFLDRIPIEGIYKKELQEFYNNISDKDNYVFKRSFIACLSGKTLNNEMPCCQ